MNNFNAKTFKYFTQAQKNKDDRQWFLDNKSLYEQSVRMPFEKLITEISMNLSHELPLIKINPKSVTRPLRNKNKAEKGLVKDFSHITLWEKKASLFEWNPAIHIQFGANNDDNHYGVGLYMVSSRQMKCMRQALTEDFEGIKRILNNKAFKKTWGGFIGETYKRFPKGYDPEDKRNQYLWHKQFYVSKNLNRTQVKDKGLEKAIIKDLKTALPFFNWLRDAVGTYTK